MDAEPANRDAISQGLNLIALAACVATMFCSGSLAVLAGAAALVSLAGSFAVSVVPSESPCERYARECTEPPPIAFEPGISQEPEQSRHWRQAVEHSRTACRRR